jgi:hypothetical protein
MPEQRNYGNSGSVNGMEMGNSSQVSTRNDFLIKQLIVMNYCLKHKQPKTPRLHFHAVAFLGQVVTFTNLTSRLSERLFPLKR